MNSTTYPLPQQAVITIRAHGNLLLTGWDRPEASADASLGYSLRVEQQAEGLRMVLLEDCELFVPAAARVVIEKVGGDLRVANLTGSLTLEKAGGDAAFVQIGEARIGKIGGDCRVRSTTGSFSLDKLGGSFRGTGLSQGASLGNCGGDITASGVRGSITGRAGGDIRVELETLQSENALRAGGDIRLYFKSAPEGTFAFDSGEEEIILELPGHQRRIHQENEVLRLGTGEARCALRAGGSILVTTQPFPGDIQFEDDASRLEERIHQRVKKHAQSAEMTQEIIERAERRAQEALRHAEERIQSALQRMERGPMGASRPTQPPAATSQQTSAAQPQPAVQVGGADQAAPVSDEERLMILRMLQEKKISVEEAEALMDALDSREEE